MKYEKPVYDAVDVQSRDVISKSFEEKTTYNSVSNESTTILTTSLKNIFGIGK